MMIWGMMVLLVTGGQPLFDYGDDMVDDMVGGIVFLKIKGVTVVEFLKT